MIDQSQQTTINKYLQSVGIEQMELFEELYDHIATSFENRIDKTQSLEVHINREIHSAFGGRTGIKKLRNKHRLSTVKGYGDKLWSLIIEQFYKVPYLLITIGTVLLMEYLAQDMKGYQLYTSNFILCLSLTLIISIGSINKFSKSCKTLNKPYTKSWINETIFGLSALGLLVIHGLTYLASVILLPYPGNLNLIMAYPSLITVLGTMNVIYLVSCYRLYKQDFHIKLQIG